MLFFYKTAEFEMRVKVKCRTLIITDLEISHVFKAWKLWKLIQLILIIKEVYTILKLMEISLVNIIILVILCCNIYLPRYCSCVELL